MTAEKKQPETPDSPGQPKAPSVKPREYRPGPERPDPVQLAIKDLMEQCDEMTEHKRYGTVGIIVDFTNGEPQKGETTRRAVFK